MGNNSSSTRNGLSIRPMTPSDVPKVKEITEFYLTEEQKTDERHKRIYSLEYIPLTLIIVDGQSSEVKEEFKGEKKENEKFIYRSLLKKEERVVGFLHYYMKKRSNEELKQIEEATRKGWLSDSLPELVPTISGIYIATSYHHKRIEIYEKIIGKMKQLLKQHKTRNCKLGRCSVLDCEVITNTLKKKRM